MFDGLCSLFGGWGRTCDKQIAVNSHRGSDFEQLLLRLLPVNSKKRNNKRGLEGSKCAGGWLAIRFRIYCTVQYIDIYIYRYDKVPAQREHNDKIMIKK